MTLDFFFQLLWLFFLVFILAPILFAPLYRYLGMVTGRHGFFRQQKTKMINPRDADARYQLGLVYLKWRYHARAHALLSEAVAIAPDQSEYQAALGIAEARLGRHESAVKHLRKALDLKPTQGYGSTQLAIANSLRKMGHAEDAAKWYRRAIERNGSLAEPYYRQGMAARHGGRRDEARDFFRKAAATAANPSPATRRHNIPWIWLARLRLTGFF